MLVDGLLIGLFVGLLLAVLCAGVVGYGRVEKWGIGIAILGIAAFLGANQWMIDHPLWEDPKARSNPGDLDRALEHMSLSIRLGHVAFWIVIIGAFVIIAGSAVRIAKNRERLLPFLFRTKTSDSVD